MVYLYLEGIKRVPDGKTVRVSFRVEDGKLADIFYSGDFFMEPPETIDKLNEMVKGRRVDLQLKNDIEKLLDKTFILGARPEDFYYVIETAIKGK